MIERASRKHKPLLSLVGDPARWRLRHEARAAIERFRAVALTLSQSLPESAQQEAAGWAVKAAEELLYAFRPQPPDITAARKDQALPVGDRT